MVQVEVLVRVDPVNDPVSIKAPPFVEVVASTSTPIVGVTVDDVDLSGSIVFEMSVGSGSIATTSTEGLHVLKETTKRIQMRGTPKFLNAALSKLTYTPNMITNGDDVILRLSASDGSGTASGPEVPTEVNVTLRLSTLNNVAPKITLPYEVVMNEGTTHPFDMNIHDIDNIDGAYAVKVVISAVYGAIRIPDGAILPKNIQIDRDLGPDPMNSPSISLFGDLKTINGMDKLINYVPNKDYHGEDQISF
jgi:hypothetical protein